MSNFKKIDSEEFITFKETILKSNPNIHEQFDSDEIMDESLYESFIEEQKKKEKEK